MKVSAFQVAFLTNLYSLQQNIQRMKKTTIVTIIFILVSNLAFSQEMTKEEKKRLKAELKSFMKDLAGYHAKMQDIKITLDSNEAEIKRMKDDLVAAAALQAETENKLKDFIKELERCNAERNILRGNPEPSGDTALVQEIMATMNATPKEGTVFKVQIGLYKEFNINKYFEQPRYIGYEDVDGLNRYIISYFKDEAVAMQFLDDVRKMGIKDAFVAKYVDGKRVYEWSKNPKYAGKPEPVSLQEALEMDKQAKKGKRKR